MDREVGTLVIHNNPELCIRGRRKLARWLQSTAKFLLSSDASNMAEKVTFRLSFFVPYRQQKKVGSPKKKARRLPN